MKGYDPIGPLPAGTTLLEASAGTGKTHAIAALATRYLAEGVVAADRLAVISFSRIASAELRGRVRGRLLRSRDLLGGVLAGAPLPDAADETDRLLAGAPRTELEDRYARLHRALGGLDRASIMTIHEFCQAMLAELDVLADQDPRASLVEDFGLLLDQIVEDLYLARYAGAAAAPPFDLATARELGREAVELGEAPLVPAAAAGLPAERLGFAAAVREEFAARKRRLGVFSFDDQLLRLRDSLRHASSPAAVERLRRRCEVVLVDEFQDTDPVQWAILQEAFDGHRPLVLIGDPKQAIYGFRGADVAAYRAAVAAAGEAFSLDVNHRADQAVVDGVNALFRNVLLGDGIEVPAVSASHPGSRLRGNAPDAVRIRCLAPGDPLDAATARRRITADLVAEVVGLLSGGTRLADGSDERDLRPSDIAVLVGTNRRGRELAEALTSAGVDVAFSGSDSVFRSPAAADWLTLLRALEEPRRQTPRAAVLTDFVGGDLAELAAADDDRLAAWGAMLQNWSRLLARSGVAALFAAVQQEEGLHGGSFAERVLGRSFGERNLTDYRHLAELLHERYTSGIRGQALIAWLAEAIDAGNLSSDRTRRLETDRTAVQIMTVHKAKGLQFPVVLVPQAADLNLRDDEGVRLVFHEAGQRVLDLGGLAAPGRGDRLRRHDQEAAEDRLRALYVSVTRAQSHLTLWWARTKRNTDASPLHRMLFRDRTVPAAPAPAYRVDTPPGDGHPRDLPWLAEAGIAVEDCPPAATVRLPAATARPARLAQPSWDRGIDRQWRRTSYSGLTEAVHARPPLGLAGEPIVDDEPPASAPTGGPGTGPESPMAALPGGVAFGSLVHQVLENLDWYFPDAAALPALRGRLEAAAAEALRRYPLAGVGQGALVDGLLPSLLTPLGRLTGGLPLCRLPIGDRLSELEFEFPLGHSRSSTTLADVSRLLERGLPDGDPLAGYPAELRQPGLGEQVLRGFLTGSIDSVLRVHGPDGPRFVVVDYKTNRLSAGPDLSLDHYLPEAMAAEMIRAHYPLQAILYCVALHRFLATRLPGYDPSVHLGGVGYLFVRGMAGAGAGDEPATGVFSWYPPAGLVAELSDLLADRGR
ncbi:MAG: UvrD-helicase domain-containing protein, partial [Propionicimonas sp.]